MRETPRRCSSLGLLLGFVLACSPVERGRPADPAAELGSVADEIWQSALDRSALLRVREGLPVEHLDDLSYQAALDQAEQARGWVERLTSIDSDALEHGDWVTREALLWDLSTGLEGLEYFWYEMVVTPYQSPLPGLRQVFRAQTFEQAGDVDHYLELLGQVDDLVTQVEERARGQLDRGILVSEANLPQVRGLVRALIAEPEAGMFEVSPERLEALDTDQRGRLRAGLGRVVTDEINPALEQLAGFLESEEYAAAVPAGVGAAQSPGGEEYYRFAVRRSTTMDVSPEQVHEIGVDMVAELEAAMAEVREEVGFTGSRTEFRTMLRTDPRFFPQTPAEVGERLMAAARRIDARVDENFVIRPAAPYGAERLDPALEGSQTYGYYQPPTPQEPRGLYFYNGSRLDQRSWIGLAAIAMHELIPGHHFHIARQLENQSLPAIRRNALHGAFTEGWGSYSSVLGGEAGVYDDDPYSRYGMYTLEVFLASRLVVDPGMNLLGMSLEQGRQYQREHTLESETQIQSESLRYSTDMPAQALAYQMGKRKLLELRERAQQELGDRFDIRRFHEAILGNGSLPMAVLERHIDWWIAEEKAH